MAHENNKRLPRSYRLKNEKEFGVVFSAPKGQQIRQFSTWFSLFAVKTSLNQGIRFGLVVGKRNAKKAVDRVLVRRLLREHARENRVKILSLLPNDVGINIVLRLKNSLDTEWQKLNRQGQKRELNFDIEKLFNRFFLKLNTLLKEKSPYDD